MPYANLPEMFFRRAAELGRRPRYRHRVGEEWKETAWETSAERVRNLSAGLIDLGVKPGDRVALLSGTRPEWVEIDLAILACGALTIPVYQSVLPGECGYILANSGATVAFVENAKQRAKVDDVRAKGFELDGVQRAVPTEIVIDIEAGAGGGPTFAGLIERGAAIQSATRGELQRRVAALGRDTLATIVYTSGTTGPPKGVPQTHGNHLASVESALKLGLIREGDVDFFFLPLAHSFARLIEYCGLAAGSTTVFARSIDTLIDDLPSAHAHIVPAVPRVFEKVYARIMAARDTGGGVKRALFDWALGVGQARSRAVQQGQPVPMLTKLQDALAQRLVFARVHQLLGGNVRLMLSGGAPLAREIAEFFHAIGVLVLEGYGLTETTPVLTVNRPDQFKLGTVGLPLDCCVIKIADDGEILAKGANVAAGYYERPEATAESWDAEGWFHTGDIGEVDAEGFLRITDRKKDLIKTSGGKYVAPQKVENLLKLQPHVSQAVLIGDNRKYCVALITLSLEEVQRWAQEHGIEAQTAEALAAHPKVQELLEGEVAVVNKELPSWESIKKFRILPRDFSTETGELTPSLKVKRKVVASLYRDAIDALYQ